MKKITFLQEASFMGALALTLISLSLITSNYYQSASTESETNSIQNQLSTSEEL